MSRHASTTLYMHIRAHRNAQYLLGDGAVIGVCGLCQGGLLVTKRSAWWFRGACTKAGLSGVRSRKEHEDPSQGSPTFVEQTEQYQVK